jgi:predicted dehydrogenase
MKKLTKNNEISRRQFLNSTAVAAAAFSFVSSKVLGLDGSNSANDRLNIAGIGIGGQGSHDLAQMESENIVALCDVDWSYAGRIFNQYPNAKKWKDYRKMLDEQKDIDAVVIATPDHHHAFAALEAMKRGKHVYCEKPLTHSVWEARQLTLAAQKYKVATQMGNQGQASEATRKLCEYILADAIGPVREVHIWTDRPARGLFDVYWPQGIARPKETPPVPKELDWDLWLGPAPERPYNPIYHPFRWRGWWDFGTGALGDIGCHAFDPVFRALKLGSPTAVEASSTLVNEETYPLGSMVTYYFPARQNMPELKLVWYDGGLRPPRPQELEPGRVWGDNGKLLVGDKGKIIEGSGSFVLIPESKNKEFGEPPKVLPRSPGHYKEWILACKGGQPAGSNFAWAGPLAETVLLGNIALRSQIREEMTRLRLEWDPVNLKIKNLDEANKFIRRNYRPGWDLTI